MKSIQYGAIKNTQHDNNAPLSGRNIKQWWSSICSICLISGLVFLFYTIVPGFNDCIFFHKAGIKMAITYGGPITITSGGTYTGNWKGSDSNTPAVTINTTAPVIITNSNISGSIGGGGGDGPALVKCSNNVNLTITNSYFFSLNPNVNGQAPGSYVFAGQYNYVKIWNNYFENGYGVKVVSPSSSNSTCSIMYNIFQHTMGQYSNGSGGWQSGDYHSHGVMAHAIQIGGSSGHDVITNCEIAWNQLVNYPGISCVEDIISFSYIAGTSTNPIRCHDNFIYGGYYLDPTTCPMNYSGSSIQGDDTYTPLNYYNLSSNIVLSNSNWGIGFKVGTHQTINNNIAVCSGQISTGPPGWVAPNVVTINAGIAPFSQNVTTSYGYRIPSGTWLGCINDGWGGGIGGGNDSTNGGSGNYSSWMRGTTGRSDWGGGSFTNSTSYNNGSGVVPLSEELKAWNIWQSRLASNNIKLGPSTGASKTTPVLTPITGISVPVGTTLSGLATANVPGAFTYVPATTTTATAVGSSYTVRLDFAEFYWSAIGQRVFNVLINGTQVLTNFDIFAAAGGKDIAISKQFTAVANNDGNIVIQFVSVIDSAKLSGLEVFTTTSPVNLITAINAGGSNADTYLADINFIGGTAGTSIDTINTSNVTIPAPPAVYNTERYGNFIYTIPVKSLNVVANFTPTDTTNYTVATIVVPITVTAIPTPTLKVPVITPVLSSLIVARATDPVTGASVSGTFAYTNTTGGVTVIFTPTNPTMYSNVTAIFATK